MAKLKAEIRILDLDKVEALKALFNEILDKIEIMGGVQATWSATAAWQKKRKEYIGRFADIIANDKNK